MKKKFTCCNSVCNQRKRIRQYILTAILATMLPLLSGCVVAPDYSDYWNPAPPSGWTNTFYDSSLNGCWRLIMINSQRVGGYDVNYLYFNGDGRGEYLYYSNGQRCVENTAYWCQDANYGNSNYQINIQYETTGSPTTMNYWFSDPDTLWMQWRNSFGIQTYVYAYQDYLPW